MELLDLETSNSYILLMAEILHQLRLVVEIPLFIGFQHHPRWFSRRISAINSMKSIFAKVKGAIAWVQPL